MERNFPLERMYLFGKSKDSQKNSYFCKAKYKIHVSTKRSCT